MRKPNRALRVIGALSMIVAMMATMIAPVTAQQLEPGTPGEDNNPAPPDARHLESAIYFPWVANNDDFGLGPTSSMISIQNLEDRDAEITISVGGTGNLTTYLSRYASKTFTAAELGISGGAPVWVTAVNRQHGFPARGYVGDERLFPIYWDELDTTPWGCFVVRRDQPNNLPPRPGFAPPDYQYRINDLPLEVPRSFIATVDIPYHEWERWVLDGNTWVLEPQEAGPYPAGSFVHLDEQYIEDEDDEDDEDQDAGGNVYDLDVWYQVQAIWEAVNDGSEDGEINPFGGLGVDSNCNAWVENGVVSTPVAIGGVAKSAVGGTTLPLTSEVDTATSGYNALNGWEVFRFDQWYLPIVQTNCGPGGCWDSVIRVSALGGGLNSVTVRFFPADDGSGSLKEGFQLQSKINSGNTWNINLSDYVPEGWVGTAHVYTDGAVFAMVDRFKAGYNMWLSNTGSSADYENVAQIGSNSNTNAGGQGRYVLFAPHVLVDYFGWNTGINVANLHPEEHNNVSIQYFNLFGNATQGGSQRLAPHGMTYFYDPSIAPQNENEQALPNDPANEPDDEGEGGVSEDAGDTTGDIVGSALIWSDYPVAAVVDATKYPESDPSGRNDLFQATSYSATQNIYTWQAVPFVSKGSPVDGSGATSGINILNPNAKAVTADVHYVNENGFNAQNFGVSSVTIPGYANGFVYTLWQQNLPNGFYGAAQVISSAPVSAVSANVDYQVDGDGSVIFNAFNPCGFYRTTQGDQFSAADIGRLNPNCSFGDALDTTGGSLTVEFVNSDGEPVQGVRSSIAGNNPSFPYQRDGFSGPDGTLLFTNVPVGEYELNVDDVPDDYMLPANPAHIFTMEHGDDDRLTVTLEWAQGFSKTVCVADDAGGCSDVRLQGVNVVVYENIGETTVGSQVAGDIVYEGVTGPSGTVQASLPVGDYILCLYDEDGAAIASSSGETVVPHLLDDTYATALCANSIFGQEFEVYGDLFPVSAMSVTNLQNPVYLAEGVLNVELYLTDLQGNEAALSNREVCLEPLANPDAERLCGTTNSSGELTIGGVLAGDDHLAPDLSDVDQAYTIETVALVEIDGPESPSVVVITPETFRYNPTRDLAQDGWLDDFSEDSDDEGSVDMRVNVLATAIALSIFDSGLMPGDADVTLYEGMCGDTEVESVNIDFDTDGIAEYVFLNMAAGTYCVEIMADNAETINIPGINISVNNRVVILERDLVSI